MWNCAIFNSSLHRPIHPTQAFNSGSWAQRSDLPLVLLVHQNISSWLARCLSQELLQKMRHTRKFTSPPAQKYNDVHSQDGMQHRLEEGHELIVHNVYSDWSYIILYYIILYYIILYYIILYYIIYILIYPKSLRPITPAVQARKWFLDHRLEITPVNPSNWHCKKMHKKSVLRDSYYKDQKGWKNKPSNVGDARQLTVLLLEYDLFTLRGLPHWKVRKLINRFAGEIFSSGAGFLETKPCLTMSSW